MHQKLYPVHFRIGRAILVLLTSCIIFNTVRDQTVAVGAGGYTTAWPGGFLPPPPAQAATLLSQGRPVVASSAEGPFAAANAVDGNAGTRWAQRLHRQRVDLRRPGLHLHHQPRGAELGIRLRQRLSDPGLATTRRPGPPSSPPPPATAAPMTSPSWDPAVTSACSAPPAPRSGATPSASSRSSARRRRRHPALAGAAGRGIVGGRALRGRQCG